MHLAPPHKTLFYKKSTIQHRCPLLHIGIDISANVGCQTVDECQTNKVFMQLSYNQSEKNGKFIRKHWKIAASVLMKLFINGNERCHTTDVPYR